MSKLRMYPKVAIVGLDLSAEPVVVVPNQSMSLREILRRFVRKESLPVSQEGIYEERMGDLEKMSKEDIVIRHERAAAFRAKLESDHARAVESASSAAPPKGDVTGSGAGAQAPPPVQDPKDPKITA